MLSILARVEYICSYLYIFVRGSFIIGSILHRNEHLRSPGRMVSSLWMLSTNRMIGREESWRGWGRPMPLGRSGMKY